MKKFVSFVMFITLFLGATAQKIKVVQERGGLPNFYKKLGTKKEVTVAFLGGSITNHPGYRVYVSDWLQQQYPSTKINSINAGVGGTGSGLGVFRMDEDVLAKKPDLVFVEFAVNDSGTDSLEIQRAMEGIVRKIWKQNIHTDICFLYTVQVTMIDKMNQGELPLSAKVMEHVAQHYNIPSIALGFVVLNQVKEGKIDFKGVKGSASGKPFFTDDGTHPTFETGHHIYADTIEGMLKKLAGLHAKPRTKIPTAIDSKNYENAKSYSINKAKMNQGWHYLPQQDTLYKQFSNKFTSIATASDVSAKLTIKFKGTRIGFYDILGPTSGAMKVVIDNREPITITRFDMYCVYYRANNFMLPVLKGGIHTVVISPDPTPIDKINILRKRQGDDKIGDFTNYKPQNVYLGKILVLGKLIKE